MPKFKFIDTLGGEQTIEAQDATSAIANAPNRASDSGVQSIPNQSTDIETTVGSALDGIGGYEPTDADKANNDLGEYYKARLDSPDKDSRDVRNAITQSMNREISAVNQIYADLIAGNTINTKGERGSARASQSRGGLLGSDFASSQNQNISQRGADIERTLQAEKGAKISVILREGKKSVVEELRRKREAQASSLKDYTNFLGSQQDRRLTRTNSLVNALLGQGIDPNDLTTEELEEVAKSYNTSVNDIFASFNTLKGEEESTLFKSIGAGGSIYDPKTGEIVGTAPKTYAPTSSNTNKFTNKNIPDNVYADLLADINSGADLNTIYNAYTDVDSNYIKSLHGSLNKKDKDKKEDNPLDFE